MAKVFDHLLSSDVYSIAEIVNQVKQQYVDEDSQTLSLGMFGYIGALETAKIQAAIQSTSELSNEMFASRAKYDRNIITHATMYDIYDIEAIPATLTAVIFIKMEDIEANMRNDRFVIDRTIPIYIDDGEGNNTYEFHTFYDVILRRVTINQNQVVYTARYDNSQQNNLSSITNPYLNAPIKFRYAGKDYIGVQVLLCQVSLGESPHKIITSNLIDNKTFIFSHEDQLADFVVEVTENGVTTTLTPIYEGGTIPAKTNLYCYYLYLDSEKVRVKFERTSYSPKINAEITVKMQTTKGFSGNFKYTSNYVFAVMSSTKYGYSNIQSMVRIQTGALNGLDAKSADELHKMIPKEALARGALTTTDDINNYFNQLNTDDDRIITERKVDNQVERTRYAHLLLKDDEGNVVPTNTIRLATRVSDFPISSTGKYIIPAGAVIALDRETDYGYLVYTDIYQHYLDNLAKEPEFKPDEPGPGPDDPDDPFKPDPDHPEWPEDEAIENEIIKSDPYPDNWPYDILFDQENGKDRYQVFNPGYITVHDTKDIKPVEPLAGVTAVLYSLEKDKVFGNDDYKNEVLGDTYPSSWPYDKEFDTDTEGNTTAVLNPGYITVDKKEEIVPVEPIKGTGVTTVMYNMQTGQIGTGVIPNRPSYTAPGSNDNGNSADVYGDDYPENWPYDKEYETDSDGVKKAVLNPGYITVDTRDQIKPVEPIKGTGVSSVLYNLQSGHIGTGMMPERPSYSAPEGGGNGESSGDSTKPEGNTPGSDGGNDQGSTGGDGDETGNGGGNTNDGSTGGGGSGTETGDASVELDPELAALNEEAKAALDMINKTDYVNPEAETRLEEGISDYTLTITKVDPYNPPTQESSGKYYDTIVFTNGHGIEGTGGKGELATFTGEDDLVLDPTYKVVDNMSQIKPIYDEAVLNFMYLVTDEKDFEIDPNDRDLFYYTNPYTIVINAGDDLYAAYYLCVIDEDRVMNYEYINQDSGIQFICDNIHWYRKFITDNTTYKLDITVSQNIQEDIGLYVEDDVIVDGEVQTVMVAMKVKVFMVLYRDGNPYRYKEGKFVSYRDDDFSFTFQVTMDTNNIILDADNNIRIEDLGICGQDGFDYGYFPGNTEAYIYVLVDDGGAAGMDVLNGVIPDQPGYSVTNKFQINDGVDFFINYSGIMSSKIDVMKANNTLDQSYVITSLPVIGYQYALNETLMDYFVNKLNYKKAYLDNANIKLENSFGIDFKFFNTYGPSKLFTLDGDARWINRVNVKLRFRLKLANAYDVYTGEYIKRYVKDIIEDLNDVSSLHIPNLITDVTNKYRDSIVFFEFVGVDEYGPGVQHLYHKDTDYVEMVPEFINVNMIYNEDGTKTADIDIEIV